MSVIVAGAFATLAFYSLYRGLELGPVAIVSPVTAAYSAITLLLAVVLLNEHLSSLAAVGAGLTIAGVVGATAVPRAVHRGDPEHDPGRAGIAYGFLAMGTFGVATFLIGSAARTPRLVRPDVPLAPGDARNDPGGGAGHPHPSAPHAGDPPRADALARPSWRRRRSAWPTPRG